MLLIVLYLAVFAACLLFFGNSIRLLARESKLLAVIMTGLVVIAIVVFRFGRNFTKPDLTVIVIALISLLVITLLQEKLSYHRHVGVLRCLAYMAGVLPLFIVGFF